MSLFRGKVNGHLRKATALLEQYQAVRSDQGSRLTQDALLEACCFELQLTLVYLLREIAENYQVSNADNISSGDELAAALGSMDKTPQEVLEIQTLQSEGWLSRLESAYLQLFRAESKSAQAVRQAPAGGLIQSKTLDQNALDYSLLNEWVNNFRELIDRQREMMVEC